MSDNPSWAVNPGAAVFLVLIRCNSRWNRTDFNRGHFMPLLTTWDYFNHPINPTPHRHNSTIDRCCSFSLDDILFSHFCLRGPMQGKWFHSPSPVYHQTAVDTSLSKYFSRFAPLSGDHRVHISPKWKGVLNFKQTEPIVRHSRPFRHKITMDHDVHFNLSLVGVGEKGCC